MITKRIHSFLYLTYPVFVLTGAIALWGCSNLVEVAKLSPPPVSDGFTFFWKPELKSPCEASPMKPKIVTLQSCRVPSSDHELQVLYSENNRE